MRSQVVGSSPKFNGEWDILLKIQESELQKSAPTKRLSMTEAATMLKDTRIRKAAVDQLQRDDVEETPTRYVPRTQAEEDYARKHEADDASEALMSTVIANAAVTAGATYNLEVESGAGKRSHLFAADVKANREATLARAEAGETHRRKLNDGLFGGDGTTKPAPKQTVTKATDEESDDFILNNIRAAAPTKGDE